MLKSVLDKSAHPRRLLRSILAVDDSPHAVALGVAVGIFVGLTPTVGIQTVLIIALAVLSRRVCYFNAPAAMASTYISNPFTMLPMYYFWYRLGMRFLPGEEKPIDLDPLLTFDGIGGWWNAICELGVQVGVPMFAGALVTAPFGAVAAYFVFLRMLKTVSRRVPSQHPDSDSTKTAGAESDTVNVLSDSPAAEPGAAETTPKTSPTSATRNSDADQSSAALTQ